MDILDPIMFADDANLFFTHKGIRYLFQIVNQELGKTSTNGLFQINFIYIYIYIYIFRKPSQKESIRLPLLLPKLIINNYEIQRTESIKF